MEKERVIQQTELTTVFTRDGKILIPIDEDNKCTIFPKYCIGIRDGYQKNLGKGEVGFFLVKNYSEDESEYKRQMAEEIGKREKRYDKQAVEDGWFIGNANALTDMGELTESIYSYQVQEMKRYQQAGYIRNGRNTFYLTTNENIEIYENVGYRFVLLPKSFDQNHFRDCCLYTIEELEEFIKTHPEGCTLDLQIAMKQLDRSKVQRFIEEIVKKQEKSDKGPIKE